MERLMWHCGHFGDSIAVFGLNGTDLAITVSASHVRVLSRALRNLGDGFGITAGRSRPRR